MLDTRSSGRSLLQRRNSLSNAGQALIDGVLVIALIVVLNLVYNGALTLQYVILAVALLGTMAVVYDRFGIYRLHGGMTQKLLTLGKAWSISFGILFLVAFLTKSTELYSRIIVTMLFVLGYLAQVAGHVGYRYAQRLNLARQEQVNALIIGTGDLATHIFERINNNPWISERVIGAITLNRKANPSDDYPSKIPVLGKLEDIRSLITQHRIRTVYIAVPLDASPMIGDIYHDLLDANVDIHWAPNIFAMNLINHSVKELSGIPILTLSETPLIGTHLLMKAIEDKVLATVALLLFSPIMLATAIAIKLESPGPVFFRQTRTGWDGKEFQIWKFRSMRLHKEEMQVAQATKDDPRVTKVGRFIRRTSIDELPQLFNVLAGQMSLVGPRPHAVQHNVEYSERITDYLARHRIKPGITGLAQVRGYRGETRELSQMTKRVHYDLEYINNWSVALDLSIMVRTLFTLFHKNAY